MHDEDSVTPAQSHKQFQFSLTALLVVVLAAACALSLVVVIPSGIAVPIIIFLSMAVPAVLTVGIVFGGTSLRPFCIGALFPTGVLLYATGWLFGLSVLEPPPISDLDSMDQWMEFFEGIGTPYRVYAGSAWFFSIIIGYACVVSQRIFLSRRHRV